MVKKILLVAASVFLGYQSYYLLLLIYGLQLSSWLGTFIAAIFINLAITGIFAFAGFALSTQRLLPAAYYRIRRPPLIKRLYDYLGVAYFRQFLLATFWRDRAFQKKFYDGKSQGLSHLIRQSKKSEFGHVIPFFILFIISMQMSYNGMIKLSLMTLLINVFFNGYPVILQRHHRMRVARILKLKKLRSGRSKSDSVT